MVQPIRNHIARTATATSKRVKAGTHAKAAMVEKQTARQRTSTKAAPKQPQAANEEIFTAPIDPAEKRMAEKPHSQAKRQSMQTVNEAEDWKEYADELDNLLQEGGKIIPDDEF
jgi:type II secretory pathway predicted ATPase ExeA